jgi:hypothetical protein
MGGWEQARGGAKIQSNLQDRITSQMREQDHWQLAAVEVRTEGWPADTFKARQGRLAE